jgi:pyruvate/2-oxoglutarate dehydrogenase complex dihydrolipoamide acyltransferase (E2) component
MSRFTRALAVGATLAVLSVAGTTTAANAHSNHDVINRHRTLGRLELPVAADHDPTRPPTQSQVGEAWHRRPAASQQDKAADATPAQPTAPAPTQANRQPSWLLVSLGVLAVLMVAGLAVLAARRASRRARLGQPA